MRFPDIVESIFTVKLTTDFSLQTFNFAAFKMNVRAHNFINIHNVNLSAAY